MAPENHGVGTNWAGTHSYGAHKVVSVTSVDDVVDFVGAGGRVRALGTRHSFNDLADTAGALLDLGSLSFEPVIDEVHERVSVPAGLTYGVLGQFLQERGWALHNLGSLPHISVAGACATATHGSGWSNKNLASQVCGLELVSGRGQRISVNEEDPQLPGFVVGLGALGVVTQITLRIEPTYNVRQDVFVNLPWAELSQLDAIMDSAYSVSLFTRWRGLVDQVWLKTRVDETNTKPKPPGGATPAGAQVMSPASDNLDNTTVQGGVPGPWNERLPHFRFDETPSNGDEIQSEYFVAREDGLAAIRALQPLAEKIAPHLLISEIRTVAADQLWLSPAYQRASLTLHFTWKNRPQEVRGLLPPMEEVLRPFSARPHWGKWFAMRKEQIAPLYERLPKFIQLAHDYLSSVIGLN
jgi:xylitol oxidase